MLQSLLQLYVKSFSGLTRDIWALSIVTFINRSGTVVFLFLSIYLAEKLNFSKTEIGLVMSSHGVGSVAGAYVGGWLTDRIGYYRVMFWSLFLVGFLYFSLVLVKTFPLFCLMGFLTSLVGDAFRPAGMASITAYGGEDLQTRSMSLYRMAINLGFGIGIAVAGFLAGMYGYEALFFMDGGTCIAAGFLFLIFLKDKKEIQSDDKLIENEKILDTPDLFLEKPKIPQQSVYKDIWYLFFIGFLFFNSIVFIQLFHTFPLFCKEVLQMTEEGIGSLMSYNGILICIIEMPLIYVLAPKRDQMGWITWGVVLIGLSLVIFNIMGFSIFTAIVSMTLVSIGEIINFPLASSLALGRSNVNNRGQYMGLYSMLFSFGMIVAPIVGFKIAEDFGYATLWYTMGLLSLISTIGLIALRSREHVALAWKEG